MARNEILSWRVEPKIKRQLQAEARHRKVTPSGLLHEVLEQWLAAKRRDDKEQARLHALVTKFSGSIASGDPNSSENLSEKVRTALRKRLASDAW
jgi:hypothetical protein